jgi:DNA-binding NarL/FixJ family response regulator
MIVDDQLPFLMAARAVVRATLGFEVVSEVQSGEEAVERVDAVAPRLVLMDINMGAMNGIEATRQIVARHPGVRVVLLSTYDADDLPADARTCGAVAYVHKERFGPDVLQNVWRDAKGGSSPRNGDPTRDARPFAGP